MWLFAICQNNILLDFLKDEISLERKLKGMLTEGNEIVLNFPRPSPHA